MMLSMLSMMTVTVLTMALCTHQRTSFSRSCKWLTSGSLQDGFVSSCFHLCSRMNRWFLLKRPCALLHKLVHAQVWCGCLCGQRGSQARKRAGASLTNHLWHATFCPLWLGNVCDTALSEHAWLCRHQACHTLV